MGSAAKRDLNTPKDFDLRTQKEKATGRPIAF
jgi:hypothetical protein